jgi:hypothetical protein
MITDDTVIGMEIVEFTTKRPHNGRRGSPAIPAGTKLYALKYANGGYFTHSYIDKADAQACIDNSILYRTNTNRFREFNLVRDVEDTMHVSPRNKS